MLNTGFVMPGPDDYGGWLRIKATVDEQYAAAAKGLAGRVRSTVETITTDHATIHVATPEAPFNMDRAPIDFHGGALVFGRGDACLFGTQLQADQHGVRCYGVDYRTPPEHPYPFAVDDGLSAYRHVLVRSDSCPTT